MDIGPEQQSVGNSIRRSSLVWIDVRRFEHIDNTARGDRALPAVSFKPRATELALPLATNDRGEHPASFIIAAQWQRWQTFVDFLSLLLEPRLSGRSSATAQQRRGNQQPHQLASHFRAYFGRRAKAI